MNRNSKATALYQSMEQWIELYREIHKCSHEAAHDAFEAWAEELIGESVDQTTNAFHEAVKANVVQMQKVSKETVAAEKPKLRKPPQSDVLVAGLVMNDEPFRNLVGGPILETGKDPLSFNDPSVVVMRPPTLTAAEVRGQVEKALNQANERLKELGDAGHPIDVDYAIKAKELAESRLRLIDEVEMRGKERKGTLSLPQK